MLLNMNAILLTEVFCIESKNMSVHLAVLRVCERLQVLKRGDLVKI